jgi:uroporphyrinogen III methyltransferase/synthase
VNKRQQSGDRVIGRSGGQPKDETGKPKIETRDDFRISTFEFRAHCSPDHPITRSPDCSGRQPLLGKRIAITRTREQAGALREELTALGGQVIEIATIEIRDPTSWEPLDSAIRRLEEFDYLLVTSANGAHNFLRRLEACGRPVRDLKGLTVAAIGPATAAELAKSGVKVDLMPRQYVAECLLEALSDRDLHGKAFLIPRAKVARDVVPRVLTEKGGRVEVVAAYETVVPELPPGELQRLLTPPPDVITFTSSSTAANFAKLAGENNASELLRGVVIASIGPITSETIRKLGLTVTIEAKESTMPGLIKALKGHFGGQTPGESR